MLHASSGQKIGPLARNCRWTPREGDLLARERQEIGELKDGEDVI